MIEPAVRAGWRKAMKMIPARVTVLLVLFVLCAIPLVSGVSPDPQRNGTYADNSTGIVVGSTSLPQNDEAVTSPAAGSVREPSALPFLPPGQEKSSYLVRQSAPEPGRIYNNNRDSMTDPRTGQNYVKERVIVRFKSPANEGIEPEKISNAHAALGARVEEEIRTGSGAGLQLVQLPEGTDVQSAIRAYEAMPDVPCTLSRIMSFRFSRIRKGPFLAMSLPQPALLPPNDSFFSDQWSFHNTGQNQGTPGADIDALGAWRISTGSDSIVIAVIDTGVLYTHIDLSANIWNNTHEIPGNGIDDDANGYIDDIPGMEFCQQHLRPEWTIMVTGPMFRGQLAPLGTIPLAYRA